MFDQKVYAVLQKLGENNTQKYFLLILLIQNNFVAFYFHSTVFVNFSFIYLNYLFSCDSNWVFYGGIILAGILVCIKGGATAHPFLPLGRDPSPST